MGLNMKENGRTTCSTERDSRPGLITQGMKGSMPSGGSTGWAPTTGMMGLGTLGNGKKTRYQGSEYTSGWMGGSLRESGRIITWRE